MAQQQKLLLRIAGQVLGGLGIKSFAIKYGLYNKAGLAILTAINGLRWRNMEVIVILWPPARELFDQIEQVIGETYPIVAAETIEIRPEKFEEFVYKVYLIDLAGERKIKPKMARLRDGVHELRVIRIKLRKPRIEAQDILNHVRCRQINKMKDGIRAKFRGQIHEYVYDVILHSTEVGYQNVPVQNLLNANRVVPVDSQL